MHCECVRAGLLLAAATLCVLSVPDAVSAADSSVPMGAVVGDVTFTDIRYLPRTLNDLGKPRAYVLMFTTLDCPLVNRYLPVIKNLHQQFRESDVQFLAVNVGAADPLIEVAQQALRIDAGFPFVKDFDGQVVRALGVTRTPEAVVLDASRKLRYRGRIDSQFRLGGARPDAGREDLRRAIEDVLAGRDVEVPTTPAEGCLILFPDPPLPEKPVTYSQHIAPLMKQHCHSCHQGGSGAFSLLTYDAAVAHAATIAEVVQQGRMPPWYASREHGEFINRRSLTASQRRQISDWVRGGCALGDESKIPEPLKRDPNAWRIGTPDLVIGAAQTMRLPATGIVPYQYILLPHVFLADTWIQKAEIRPSNAKAVHHCNMAYVSIGQKFSEANFVTGQVPGGDAMELGAGIGFKIPAFSMLALQVHYVTTGEETADRISVGLGFPREVIQKRLHHFQVVNRKFAITPGDPHHAVSASRTLKCDATGVGMFAHMHVRGKDMTFRSVSPEGRAQTLLSIPNYSFDWQMPYVWEPGRMRLARGTRIECLAHFDNSAFNPYNPDPTATVREGQQTHEEMMMGFFFYTDDGEQLNLHTDPKTGREIAKPADSASGASTSAARPVVRGEATLETLPQRTGP